MHSDESGFFRKCLGEIDGENTRLALLKPWGWILLLLQTVL